jgi:hypothetical protein
VWQIAMNGSFTHSRHTITSHQMKIDFPPSNLVIPALLAMMELAETFIFAHHVIKVVMV